jgi:hypothetical protein
MKDDNGIEYGLHQAYPVIRCGEQVLVRTDVRAFETEVRPRKLDCRITSDEGGRRN